MIKSTLIKEERLNGKTTVDELFSSDKSFFCYPYRVVYVELTDDEPQAHSCRVMFNVPKRLHKRAVMRNGIRRKVKEVYRLHKNDLYQQLGDKRIHLAILYSSKEDLPYELLEQKWLQVQSRLISQLSRK